MGAYATLKITRRTARRIAISYMFEANDKLLARVVDEILRERLYNCTIVDDGSENDDDKVEP